MCCDLDDGTYDAQAVVAGTLGNGHGRWDMDMTVGIWTWQLGHGPGDGAGKWLAWRANLIAEAGNGWRRTRYWLLEPVRMGHASPCNQLHNLIIRAIAA